MSPSATNRSPAASPIDTFKLNWYGVLTPEHRATLRSKYGSLIICPGYVSTFGKKTDSWGPILVPGATSAVWTAQKTLAGWEEKNRMEKFSWWPDFMRERGITPITGNDIFNGLKSARWLAYRKEYDRASAARGAHKRRQKSHEDAQAAEGKRSPDIGGAEPH